MVAERTPDDRPASEAVHVQGDEYVEPPHVQTSLDAVNWAFRHFEGADWSGLPPRQSVPYLDARGYHIDHPSRPLNKDAYIMHPDGYTLDPPGYTWDGKIWRGPSGEPIE